MFESILVKLSINSVSLKIFYVIIAVFFILKNSNKDKIICFVTMLKSFLDHFKELMKNISICEIILGTRGGEGGSMRFFISFSYVCFPLLFYMHYHLIKLLLLETKYFII